MNGDLTALIEQSKDGDKESFSGLYDMFFEKILKYIFFKTLQKETAEDLTSLTFLKAYEKLHQYKPVKGSFSAWLFGIARNQVNDYFRKTKKTIDIFSLPELKSQEDMLEDLYNKEQVARLKITLKKLKPAQKEIILLRVWQNLSYSDIADIIGKSEANCKMIFSRTLMRLRNEFSLAVIAIILARIYYCNIKFTAI